MNGVLQAATVAYILYCLFNIWRRPGAFAGMMLCSFGLGALSGSLGAIAAAAAILASTGALFLKRAQTAPFSVAEVGFVLWLAETVLLAFWSPQMEITGSFLSLLFGLNLPAYIFARTFARTPNFMRQLYWSSILATTLTYSSLVLSASTFGRLGSAATADASRNAVGLSVLGELGLILTMAMLFFDRQSSFYVKLAVFFLLAAVVLPFTLSTGTRGVVLSCGIVLAIYLAIFVIRSEFRTTVTALSLSAVGIPAAAALFLVVAPAKLRITLAGGLFRLFQSSQGPDPSTQERLSTYAQATSLFKEAPLFGYGPGAFTYMNDGIGATGNNPHNLELELLTTGGLLGLALFAWFVLPLLWQAIRAALKSPVSWEAAAVLGMIVSGLIRLQASFSVANAKLVYFGLGCSAALWTVGRLRAPSQPSPENALPQAIPTEPGS